MFLLYSLHENGSLRKIKDENFPDLKESYLQENFKILNYKKRRR